MIYPEFEIKITSGFDPGEELYDAMCDATIDIAVESRNYWETVAGQNLNKTRDRYIKALEFVQKGENEISIHLNPGKEHKLANMLEGGWESFDMKPGFLKGRTYRVIPLDTPSGRIFKTVSLKSSEYSWWNLGEWSGKWGYRKEGYNFREEVAKEMEDNIIPRHIDRVIASLNRGQ